MAVGESVSLSGADADARQWAAIERRVAELERRAQRKTLSGFHVWRSSNDSAIPTSSSLDITWNSVVETTWSTFAGFTSGSALTVPPDGAGIYAISAALYWVTPQSSVLMGMSVNGGTAQSAGSVGGGTYDRLFLGGLARFAAGDIIRLHILNISGATITPTVAGADVQTPHMPTMQAWRIST